MIEGLGFKSTMYFKHVLRHFFHVNAFISGAMTASASTNTVASALSQSKAASQSKPATPTPNSLTVPSQNQSKSDSEMESTKKTAIGEKTEKISPVKAIKVCYNEKNSKEKY